MRVALVTAITLSVTFGAIVLLAACSGFNGTSTGEPVDATVTDAGASADSTSPTDAGSALDSGSALDAAFETGDLFDDNFESATVNETCADWVCSGCTTNVVSGISHTGAKSCQICLSQSNATGVTYQLPTAGAGNYTFNVWVATMDDAGVASGDAGLVEGYVYFFDDAGIADETPEVSTALVPQTWARLQFVTSAPVGADVLSAIVTLYDEPQVTNDCWYIDDVSFYKQ